jgi:RHS repeat-associated protein
MNLASVDCSTAQWNGVELSGPTTSLNNTLVGTCTNPDGSTGTLTETITGGSNPTSVSTLTVNQPAGTYAYQPQAVALNVPDTITGCGSTDTSTLPAYAFSDFNPTYTFTLPSSAQPLSMSGFTRAGETASGAMVPFVLTFDLEPHYTTDDDCDKAAGSSIGCTNQALREDIPVTGTEFGLIYDSSRATAGMVAGTDAIMLGGWLLNVHHAYDPASNTLYLGNGQQRNAWRLGAPFIVNGDYLIAAQDGLEVYEFDATGHHLRTRWPLTGAIEYQFAYDANNKLVSITDGSGNVTTVQRDANGNPTAIVSPYGLTTTLQTDTTGFLSAVIDPAGNKTALVNGPTGLLATRTDPIGSTFSYSYDGVGRLVRDADQTGGFTALARTASSTKVGQSVAHTDALGRTSSYQTLLTVPWTVTPTSPVSEDQTVTWSSGLQVNSNTTVNSGNLSQTAAFPDGTGQSASYVPDDRWGLAAPFAASATLTSGTISMNLTSTLSTTLANSADPFSLSAQTGTTVVNGNTYRMLYAGSSHTLTSTTPAGRTTTSTLDALERVTSVADRGFLPLTFTYDAHGRPASMTRGARSVFFSYDQNGFLATSNNRMGLKTGFGYDLAGRLTSMTAPDGRVTGFQYDANGNLTGVTPPGRPAHTFSYSALSLLTTYTPPVVPNGGSTAFAYNLDQDLTGVTRPDGGVITFGYDSAGRISSVATPTNTLSYSYDPTTGNVSSESIAGGESLAYTYNGNLVTGEALTGAVTASVTQIYDNNGRIVSESVDGANTVSVSYDADGIATQVGALAITLNPATGLPSSTSLGVATDASVYAALGDLASYSASASGSSLYSVLIKRDLLGRVSSKAETVAGVTSYVAYQYDPAGRLVGVYVNGSLVSSYGYDTNSNRISATTSAGAVSATVDAQDRLLTYGSTSFTYTANGELTSRTTGPQTSAYSYDALGNLLSVTLPSGDRIDYVVDGEDRRVGKKKNGVLVSGYAYSGPRLVAELDGSNAIVSRFVYGTRNAVPDYMIRGGVTYRIFSDPLGSPRLVVNTVTGQIAARIDYDEFGNQVANSAPGFIPFGFAGGLSDPDTGLVRFGARDYDPSTGRWTAKDPILFLGEDPNLYAYVGNDPINVTDGDGRCDKVCQALKKAAKDPLKTAKEVRKAAEKIRKDGVVGAVKSTAMDAAKAESPMSGSATKDLERSQKETAKTGEIILQKTVPTQKEAGEACIVNLQGGKTEGNQTDRSTSQSQQNQPPVPRGPPPTMTTTQAQSAASRSY